MTARTRARAAIAAAALILAGAMAASSAAALEATEPAIKAAFLYKFGFFVEWPQAAFAAGDSPITVCIVGSDPFGPMLDDTVKGQRIGERPIAIRRMSSIARDSGCHIVFFSESDGPGSATALAALRGSGVLTVTDAESDAGAVGIINFVIKDHRVRFDIDDAAAASGGLVISSRLLNLALDVKPRH